MRIPDDYFAAIAEDLTEEQAESRVAELRALCAAVEGFPRFGLIVVPSGT